MRIILLGAPGVGKGTQAKLINEHFKIPHISTGDIFRTNIGNKTNLGIMAKEYIDNGQLVPDSLTIALIKDRLKEEDCEKGFILDGFPRNLYQARELAFLLAFKKQYIDMVLNISIPEELILERITGRRFCKQCGASYHIKFNPPIIEGICDKCGGVLSQRNDDNEEVVKNRLAVYHKMTKPLIDYYKNIGILREIRGDLDINEVFYSICANLQAV